MFKVGQRVWVKPLKEFGIVEVLIDYREVIYFVNFDDKEGNTFQENDLHETADDMFERLGYLDQGGDEWHHDKLNKNIYFDVDKTISCYSYHENIPTVRNESMTIDEFKASYQMCIEKGWIE